MYSERRGHSIGKVLENFVMTVFAFLIKNKKRNSKAISSKFLKVTRINTCDRELRNCDTISAQPLPPLSGCPTYMG